MEEYREECMEYMGECKEEYREKCKGECMECI
jgi:hypothetical protein